LNGLFAEHHNCSFAFPKLLGILKKAITVCPHMLSLHCCRILFLSNSKEHMDQLWWIGSNKS
jgi:hypothetical protein